jgi:3-oxoacyl-[acyl-carrier protein] reductase
MSNADLVTLIIGSEGGLGTSITNHFRSQGANLLALSRKDVDLRSEESVEDIARQVSQYSVGTVIINAAQNVPMSLSDPDLISSIHDHFQVNFASHATILLSALPNMVRQRYGRIVAVSSLYAERARSGRLPYSLSKASLETFVRSVALEYASHNILANSIRPGFLDTPLTRRNNSEEKIRNLVDQIPLGSLGDVGQVTRLVEFLGSPRNEYITGQAITVDGGFSLS